ncbi:MAG: VWA domain-containing protein [Alphaproteobacteria bacterium]|nr:VWA domain-containing protein [Alphaproteobacteria bacterium]
MRASLPLLFVLSCSRPPAEPPDAHTAGHTGTSPTTTTADTGGGLAHTGGHTGDTGPIGHTGGTGDTGTAPSPPRAIMLVVDMSSSMMGTSPDAAVQWARAANLTFLDALEQTPRGGDMLGMALFATYATSPPTPAAPTGIAIRTDTPSVSQRPWAPLADVSGQGAELRRLFRGICDTGSSLARCRTADAPDYELVTTGGTWAPHPTRDTIETMTNPQPALLQAVNELVEKTDAATTYRGILFLSDGVPNAGGGEDGTTMAVDEAWANGIHVWSVLVHNGSFNDAFLRSLVRGDGTFHGTSQTWFLPTIYEGIAAELP